MERIKRGKREGNIERVIKRWKTIEPDRKMSKVAKGEKNKNKWK